MKLPSLNSRILVVLSAVLASNHAHALIDSDNDGMSDVWEAKFGFSIGSSPPAGELPNDDPDGDGWTNLQESEAGTDPNLANPPLGIVATELIQHPDVPSVFIISWPSIEGKLYTLYASPDLSSGSWVEVDDAIYGTGETISYGVEPLDDAYQQFSKVFFRISILDTDSDGDTLSDWEELELNYNPYSADSDLDGIPDNLDQFPLVSATLADPDGMGVAATITNSGMVAWWDFQAAGTGTSPKQFNSRFAPLYHPLKHYMGTQVGHCFADKGITNSPSFSTRVDLEVFSQSSPNLRGTNTLTINYWLKIPKNELDEDPVFDQAHEYTGPNSNQYASATDRVITLASYGNSSVHNPTLDWRAMRSPGNGTRFELRGYSGYVYTNYFTPGMWDTPTRIDDGEWHHVAFRVTGSGNNIRMYLDGAQVGNAFAHSFSIPSNANSTGAWLLIGGTKRVFPGMPAQTPATSYSDFRGKMDSIMVHNRALSEAEIQGLYKRDRDSDGLWDITEIKTSLWRDDNANGVEEDSEITYLSSPFHWQPPDTDTDGDGATDIVEQGVGTLIGNPDTDGDLIPDGWEIMHGLNPKVPNTGDTDGDGLSDLDEYRYNTNPNVRDSDGDGIEDGPEHNNGSHPGDNRDNGQPLPPGERLTINLGVGDRSGSESEDYVLHVYKINPQTGAEERFYTLRSGGYGKYEEMPISIFRKGDTYTFQIDWQGSNLHFLQASEGGPEGPDFDYHMVVEPLGDHGGQLIDSYDTRTKTIRTDDPILDPYDVNPEDDNDDNVEDFVTRIEHRRVALVYLKVEWESVSQDASLEDHVDPWTSNVNGDAWHADAPTPDDSTFRDVVGVRVSGGLPNAEVWLRSFDVDDTTSETWDTDGGTSPPKVDTNGESGLDNRTHGSEIVGVPRYGRFLRPGGGLGGRFSGRLDATGAVLAKLRIGVSPGNNYRIVATQKSQAELEDLYVTLGLGPANKRVTPLSTHKPDFEGSISPLLTIWRRLWLELDTMTSQDTPPAGEENWIHGNVTSIAAGTPLPGGVPVWDCVFDGNMNRNLDEFEKGWLHNTTTLVSHRIHDVVQWPSGAIVVRSLSNPGSTGQYALLDDDNTGLPVAYSPILPRLTIDFPYVAGKFRSSFITLSNPDQYNTRRTIPFKLNAGSTTGVFLPGVWNNSADLEDSKTTWVAHAVFGFQDVATKDCDPDSETGGASSGQTPFFPVLGKTLYSVIWLEQIREDFESSLTHHLPAVVAGAQAALHREINLTLTHEIGHLPSNLVESISDSHHDEDGIMQDGGSGGADNDFTPATVSRFRKSVRWTQSETE